MTCLTGSPTTSFLDHLQHPPQRPAWEIQDKSNQGIQKEWWNSPSSFLLLVVRPEPLVASLLLVAMPGAPGAAVQQPWGSIRQKPEWKLDSLQQVLCVWQRCSLVLTTKLGQAPELCILCRCWLFRGLCMALICLTLASLLGLLLQSGSHMANILEPREWPAVGSEDTSNPIDRIRQFPA